MTTTAAGAPSIPAGILVAGTRAEVHRLSPGAIALPLRRAMADRCRRLARGHFAKAREAQGFADAEHHQAEGRAWMREARRWATRTDGDA